MDRETAIKLYLGGMTTREVAAATGASKSAIGEWVREVGASRPRKPRPEKLISRQSRLPGWDRPGWFDGLMLSDGNLSRFKGCCSSSCLRVDTTNEEWADLLVAKMRDWLLEPRKACVPRRGKCFWNVRSLSFLDLGEERLRWYSDQGVKRPPPDIDLTDPEVIRYWILGDGTKSRTILRICTDSFLREDTERLAADLGRAWDVRPKLVMVGIDKKSVPKYRISLCKRDGVEGLLKSIGPCPVASYSYKWR